MASVFDLRNLSDEDKVFCSKSLECDGDEVFAIQNDNYLYLPFAFAHKNFVLDDVIIEPTESMIFTGVLRPAQRHIKDNVLNNKSMIICAQPGFGKTITAIAVACERKLKTVVIVNKLLIMDQWIKAFNMFTPDTKVQIINPKHDHLDDNVSVFIVNAINVVKKPYKFWSKIKFVIVDELHQIVTKKLCFALLRFVPYAILGLSATPYRYDNYDTAIEWFFGQDMIGETLNRSHKYKIIKTNWVPQHVHYTKKGLDWGKILDDQANNEKRNKIIVHECVEQVKQGRTVLILVKRVVQADLLSELLYSNGVENVAKLVRSDRTFDKKCNVLIGTTSKIGVGFDHAPIDCLVVAADVKNYFVQFLGRCMRSLDTIPIVLDFDDDFKTLTKHLNERLIKYKIHGGTHLV